MGKPSSQDTSQSNKLVENDPESMDKELERLFGHLQVFEEKNHTKQILPSLDLKGISEHLKMCRKVVVLCGAGISTSVGIPDFRSKGSGLYEKLEKYNLPGKEAIFNLPYFKENPFPFYDFWKHCSFHKHSPSLTHRFIKLLHDKNQLLRVFTQNIDNLERKTGLDSDAIVQAHGSPEFASCVECKKQISSEEFELILEQKGEVKCDRVKCKGYIKV